MVQPPPAASPGNLREMQALWLQPRLTVNLCFNEIPSWIICTLIFEKYRPRGWGWDLGTFLRGSKSWLVFWGWVGLTRKCYKHREQHKQKFSGTKKHRRDLGTASSLNCWSKGRVRRTENCREVAGQEVQWPDPAGCALVKQLGGDVICDRDTWWQVQICIEITQPWGAWAR